MFVSFHLSYYHEANDIFLLQECNIPYRSNYKSFEDRWSHGQSVWSGDNKNRSSGVAVLLNGPDFNIQRVQHIIHGRLLCVDVTWNNVKLRIVNVYCPPDLQERLQILDAIQPLLLCSSEVVLGGDFNCLLNKKDKLSNATVKLDSSSEVLKNLTQDFKLIDTFRSINPSLPGFTWSDGKTHSRIDFLFASKGLLVHDATVTPAFFSDHLKIDCALVFKDKVTKGRGLWKLNVSLLQDEKVVKRFKAKLKQWSSLQFLFNSIGEWWEDLKSRAKNFFIEEGKRVAKKKRFKLKTHQAKLQRLYTNAHSGLDVAEDIAKLKREMMCLSADVSRGILIRSKIYHVETNEKCSRYFFRKLAKNKNTIEALTDENGTERTEIKDILSRVHTFYSHLYRNEDLDREALENLLSNVDGKVRGHNGELERDLSLHDLTQALESMQNSKAPGADGLPKEFYTTFWPELQSTLLEIYKESLRTGKLPPSMREGTISLLFKKGDRKDIKNWRPLTLLGVDRKILAKALYFRILDVVEKIVGADQTCAIPGRSMSDSLALVRDSYLYSVDRKISLSITGLDLEKAFDRLNQKYFKEVLSHFGFGPQMRAWIDLIYSDCISRVIVNGHTTEPFQVSSGVRQGCPLSVLLFILSMEPLACAIRKDVSVKGIIVPGSKGKEAKLTMYMDDMTILCTDNSLLLNTLRWCEQFSLASGAKVNKVKSEILYLNWQEEKPDLGLVEKKERLKILGIEIGKDMEKENWEKRLSKIKGKLVQWEDRELTFTGKVLVIKADVLSSLTFLAATLPVPRSFLMSLRRIMFQFIWGSCQEYAKREIMYKPLDKEGKAVPELEAKLNALFLTPILNAVLNENSVSLWTYFAKFWAGPIFLRKMGKRLPLHTPHA